MTYAWCGCLHVRGRRVKEDAVLIDRINMIAMFCWHAYTLRYVTSCCVIITAGRRMSCAEAQANLGLRRTVQCEKCLGLASMLALKEPNMTTNTMRSQLSRLYGQLYALEVIHSLDCRVLFAS